MNLIVCNRCPDDRVDLLFRECRYHAKEFRVVFGIPIAMTLCECVDDIVFVQCFPFNKFPKKTFHAFYGLFHVPFQSLILTDESVGWNIYLDRNDSFPERDRNAGLLISPFRLLEVACKYREENVALFEIFYYLILPLSRGSDVFMGNESASPEPSNLGFYLSSHFLLMMRVTD